MQRTTIVLQGYALRSTVCDGCGDETHGLMRDFCPRCAAEVERLRAPSPTPPNHPNQCNPSNYPNQQEREP